MNIIHPRPSIPQVCEAGHVEAKWWSQPEIKSGFPVGNFMLCSAVVLTGSTLTKSKQLLQSLNMETISKAYFCKMQSDVLAPRIASYYEDMLAATQSKYVGKDVIIMGDGANDSPGHTAK